MNKRRDFYGSMSGLYDEYPYAEAYRGVGLTCDMDTPLQLNPHYTDERFNKEQTVFGSESKGLFYNYSDRLWQGDYSKAQEASFVATESGARLNSARWLQVFLAYYHGKPVHLRHVIAGINRNNLYAYYVCGYTFPDKPPAC